MGKMKKMPKRAKTLSLLDFKSLIRLMKSVVDFKLRFDGVEKGTLNEQMLFQGNMLGYYTFQLSVLKDYYFYGPLISYNC